MGVPLAGMHLVSQNSVGLCPLGASKARCLLDSQADLESVKIQISQ